MLKTIIRKNNYQDSINLMLLTNEINALEGITKSAIMMGTDANKDIFQNSGLLTEEAKAAAPADMVIVMDAADEGVIETALETIDHFLSDLTVKRGKSGVSHATSLENALDHLPDANLALFSIPGEYAADEMMKALETGLHVFSFTDNVSQEDELRLKTYAHENGLLMMGPDCGTGIISGIPMAFTNVVKPGNIGIVGASGTGIQEVSSIIDRLGGGVVHAIGTGGRDLSEAIGAITVKDALVALEVVFHPEDLAVSVDPAECVAAVAVHLPPTLRQPAIAHQVGHLVCGLR